MEDVKTVFRLLVVGSSLWVIVASLYLHQKVFIVPLSNSRCISLLLSLFTYSPLWSLMICTVIYEFCVYPILRNKIPTIIKRIGISSFLIVLISTMFLILELIYYFHPEKRSIPVVLNIAYLATNGILSQLLLCAILELVLAQAPYSMRGVLGGYVTIPFFVAAILGGYSSDFQTDTSTSNSLVMLSVKPFVSILGFILYCIVACWYKRRVRDDVFNAHRVVEEVYDRYLTQEAIIENKNYKQVI